MSEEHIENSSYGAEQIKVLDGLVHTFEGPRGLATHGLDVGAEALYKSTVFWGQGHVANPTWGTIRDLFRIHRLFRGRLLHYHHSLNRLLL